MAQTQTGWSPGSRVGDFELLHRLGGGGMGEVHAARHLATGATVALKTLSYHDPELLLRFQREAEAQARVDAHPNVVRIHASGVHQGRPYLVMDLVGGGDLDQRLEAAPLAPVEAAALVAQLARAIAHCHAHHVLHRDLKPANVLFDDDQRPLLVDFGLASLADASSLTQTGTLLGTPAFMAPEQASGRRDQIGPPTDVYGLGALLYACLTGRPPHQGRGHLDVLRRVIEETPSPPSALRPGVPAALDRICLGALAKDRAARPSPAALVEQLDAFLAAPSASPRRAPPALLALLIVATLGAALAAATHTPPPTPAPDDVGVSPAPSAPASPTPAATPALPPAQAALLREPVARFHALQDQAADPLELAAALVAAAPSPGFLTVDTAEEAAAAAAAIPRLTALAQAWRDDPAALPSVHRATLVAAARIHLGYQVQLAAVDEGRREHPLLAVEGLLFRALMYCERRQWSTLEAQGEESLLNRLLGALSVFEGDPSSLAFAMRLRAQRTLYRVLRSWWLSRGVRVPLDLDLLLVELCPESPTADHLRTLAAIEPLSRSTDGFRVTPAPDPALRARLDRLPDLPTDRFLGAALGVLLDPAPTQAALDAAVERIPALPTRRPWWCGELALRVLERWVPGALLAAWEGDHEAVAPLLALDPALFGDPRPAAVLRAHALLTLGNRRNVEAFVGELGETSDWWVDLPHDALLYHHWRSLLGAESSLMRPYGEISGMVAASLPTREPTAVERPLERAFHLHLLHLRKLLEALGKPQVAPEVPDPIDLGPAQAYLPIWRSPAHTQRTIRAILYRRWRPWVEPTRPGPPPSSDD